MQRITTLLAFTFCAAVPGQSIEIPGDVASRATVALTAHCVGSQQSASSVPVQGAAQPSLVTHLLQGICVPAPLGVPAFALPSLRCETSDGGRGPSLRWDAFSGLSHSDARADVGLALATDSPANGAVLWLRADAGVRSSAGKVWVWRDLSGQGNEATMATPARQPTLVSGALNGHPVIHFGGAQSLYLSSWVSPTQFTIFIVGKNDGASGPFSMILGPGGQSPNNQLRWLGGDRVECIGQGNGMPVTVATIGSNVVYHELSLRYDGSVMTIYRDGIAVSSHSFSTTGPWTFSNVGAYTSLFYMYGDLAEVLIYPTALPEVDRVRTSRYHRSRYGL